MLEHVTSQLHVLDIWYLMHQQRTINAQTWPPAVCAEVVGASVLALLGRADCSASASRFCTFDSPPTVEDKTVSYQLFTSSSSISDDMQATVAPICT